MTGPRVAYVWSPRLEAVSNDLPANVGRSGVVHALIRALKLAAFPDVDERSEEGADGSASALVIPPDPELATEAELRRYHDGRYVDYLLRDHTASHSGINLTAASCCGNDSSDDDSPARRKRRKTSMGLEYDCPPFRTLPEYALLVSGATLTACRRLAAGETDVAIVWDGGRHHAARARASGFCYVADIVLGVLLLGREGVPAEQREEQRARLEMVKKIEEEEAREEEEEEARLKARENELATEVVGDEEDATNEDTVEEEEDFTPLPPEITPSRRPRILYLDLDLHYGDGVASAFHSPTQFPHPLPAKPPRPPQVLTLSIHHAHATFFPPGAPTLTPSDTPSPFSLSLPLAAFAHPVSYARAFVNVERIRKAWRPDYVVLQLGVDGLPRDPVGHYGAWNVAGVGGVRWCVQQVMAWNLPTAILGGGGYVSVNAARAWALATAEVLGRGDVGVESDVPDEVAQWEEYGPSFTLEVPESNVPDENTAEELDKMDAEFAVLAERIREIVNYHA